MQATLTEQPIVLSDKPYFKKTASISFENFTNIYMWRHVMHYRMVTVEGVRCLVGHYGNRPDFCNLPDVADDAKLRRVLEGLRKALGTPLLLRPLDKGKLERVLRLYPNAEVSESRNMQDYIYLQSDLANLPGKEYHPKRNHINNFEKQYDWEFVSITAETIPLLREAAAHLFEIDGRLPDEYEAILDLLDHFEALELKAGVLLVEGTPVAYAIGEIMNADTALIHIEKADRSYTGAYAMINRLFAAEFDGCTYINREEDMGIPGLRKAKSSYHPVQMGDFYTAKI